MKVRMLVRKRFFFSAFFILGLLLGLIAGAVGMSILAMSKLEKLHKSNYYLNCVIEEQENKLEKLQKSINKNQYVLTNVKVVFTNISDEYEIITMEKAVKDKYKYLLGKPVDKIDINLVAEVVDKRVFQTEMHQYKLKVEKIALSEELKLWISIEEIV